MRFKLVALFALLTHWKLIHILPEWHAHAETLAWCRWSGQMDRMAAAMSDGTKTCTWLLAGPYGRPNELQTFAAAAMQWLIDSAKLLTTGT